MGLRAFILGSMLFVIPCTAIAQEHPSLRAGDILRVHRPSHPKVKVTLLAVFPDSLVVERAKVRDTLQLALDQVTRIEIRSGSKSAWLTGLGLGAAGGLLLGTGIGAIVMATSFEGDLLYPIAGAVVGVGIGAISGAVIGAFVRKDRWTEVDLDAVRLELIAARRGSLGLRGSWRF